MIKYLSDKPANVFAKEWHEIFTEDHFWITWRLQSFLKQLKALGISLDDKLRGIDIGCGRGIFRKSLETVSNWIIDGADIDESALKVNGNCRGDTYYYDIHDRYPKLQGKYDFAIIFDILEHIENETHFIASTSFHVKKGGRVFGNVPALQTWYSKFDHAVGHLRRYNKRTLREVFENSGLYVEDIRYWGAGMIPLLILRKALFMTGENTPEQIINKGSNPPGTLFSLCMRLLMSFEYAIPLSPFLGTSINIAAVKI